MTTTTYTLIDISSTVPFYFCCTDILLTDWFIFTIDNVIPTPTISSLVTSELISRGSCSRS
jgi:hypothetical protein